MYLIANIHTCYGIKSILGTCLPLTPRQRVDLITYCRFLQDTLKFALLSADSIILTDISSVFVRKEAETAVFFSSHFCKSSVFLFYWIKNEVLNGVRTNTRVCILCMLYIVCIGRCSSRLKRHYTGDCRVWLVGIWTTLQPSARRRLWNVPYVYSLVDSYVPDCIMTISVLLTHPTTKYTQENLALLSIFVIKLANVKK